MVGGKLFGKIMNLIAGIFAMATIALMLVWYINNALGGVLLNQSALATVERFRNYFTLATIFCCGIGFTLQRSILLAIIFSCIVAAVALFMVYTDVQFGF